MVVLALINRFRLLPRLRREPQPSAPIAALARCSSSRRFGFAVLAVVSVPFTITADDAAAVRSRKHLILPCRGPERPVSSERNCNAV
jgi:hypothetical protein